MNYYNEFDPHAAAWLRELIARKLLPDGIVDERSITEIHAPDLQAFTQCHFFAGIGGWSLALQLAGVSLDTRLWTGSCPCQPFSSAGKGEGKEDERHLWPTFFKLIEACRPPVVFGEQVASALVVGKAGGGHREEDGPVWLDGVFADLESAGYTTGATVLGAHSVGAPHIRQRLYWVAQSQSQQSHGSRDSWRGRGESPDGGDLRRMADSIGEGLEGHRGDERDRGEPGRLDALAAGSVAAGGAVGGMGLPDGDGRQPGQLASKGSRHGDSAESAGFWSDCIWIPCRDGKHRRVPAQSVLQPVADGLPDLVGAGWGDLLEATPGLAEAAKGFPLASSDPFKLATRGTVRPALLKGTGNAIVPEVAATFIAAFYEVTQ